MRYLTCVLALCSTVSFATEHRYQISFNNSLTESESRLCFYDKVPRFLTTMSSRATERVLDVRIEGKGQFRVDNKRIWLTPEDDRLCLVIEQSLRGNPGQAWRQARRGFMSFNGDRVIPIDQWLWRPARLEKDESIVVNFRMPSKRLNVAAPWPSIGKNQYRIDHSMPYNWTGRLAIGEFALHQLTLNQRPLQVALVGGLDKRKTLLDWIDFAAGSVAAVSDQFPPDGAQVLVFPVGSDREAVPWAEIQRQGRPSVHFFIDQHRPLLEFKQDWTAAHEFSHLLHPYILRQDSWLYEGIASYYQNIARAMTGQLTEQQAWQKLYDGFMRGKKELTFVSLERANKFMQMYWGGAAVMLMADVRLREQSEGQWSLARVLREFGRCCQQQGPWSARALFNQFDQITGYEVFSQLYWQEVKDKSFPNIDSLLPRLGVQVRNGVVFINPDAELSLLRKTIIQ